MKCYIKIKHQNTLIPIKEIDPSDYRFTDYDKIIIFENEKYIIYDKILQRNLEDEKFILVLSKVDPEFTLVRLSE